MTPTLPELLMGQCLTLSTPLPPEAGPDYAAARLGMLATLALLAAEEAERGPAVRAWENGAIARLLRGAGEGYASVLADFQAHDGEAVGETWSALDAENARLRRGLIALHTAAEDAGDTALQTEILALYSRMAHERRLTLPTAA